MTGHYLYNGSINNKVVLDYGNVTREPAGSLFLCPYANHFVTLRKW